MNNEQFITRNFNELGRVILAFRELDEVYPQNLCLYLDKNYWEVFDIRCGKAIIRHDFKHLTQLSSDMKTIKLDIIQLGYYSIHPKQVKRQCAKWAFTRLSRIYSPSELKYFTHGKNYETEIDTDCD